MGNFVVESCLEHRMFCFLALFQFSDQSLPLNVQVEKKTSEKAEE